MKVMVVCKICCILQIILTFFEELQIKIASSHIIPVFTCSLYTAYLLLILLEMFLNCGPSFPSDNNVFFFLLKSSKVTS